MRSEEKFKKAEMAKGKDSFAGEDPDRRAGRKTRRGDWDFLGIVSANPPLLSSSPLCPRSLGDGLPYVKRWRAMGRSLDRSDPA